MVGTPLTFAKIATDPAQLPENERIYYRTTWGFDPVGDCQSLGNESFRYEVCMPLMQDLPLQAAGVTICARVDWQGEAVHNRIVFRRQGAAAIVDCIHSIIAPISDFNALGDIPKHLQAMSPAKPAILPPWEHFAALKSYVAAVTEMGILALLSKWVTLAAGGPSPEMGVAFRFNTELQHQIIVALSKLAPNAMRNILFDICREILDQSPPSWVMANWHSLSTIFPLQEFCVEDPEPFLAWVEKWAKSAPDLYDAAQDKCGRIFEKIPVKVFQTWTPDFLIHLFRDSNLCDRWQEQVFFDPKLTGLQPSVPWNDLRREQQAREFAEELEERYADLRGNPSTSIDAYLDVSSKTPDVEIWPRAIFAAYEFPPYLVNNDKNSRMAHRRNRIKYFLRDITANSEDSGGASWSQGFRYQLPHNLRKKAIPIRRNTSIKLPQDPTEARDWCFHQNSLKRYAALQVAEIPEDIQNRFVMHPDFATRLSLAVNPHVHAEILSRLVFDRQPCVRAVASARITRGIPILSPLVGEILSPGEILWLLASNPAIFFEFGVTTWGDGSPAYREWISSQLSRHPRWRGEIGEVYGWAYFGGILFEDAPENDRDYGISHLALRGLSDRACGRFPCIYLGVEDKYR